MLALILVTHSVIPTKLVNSIPAFDSNVRWYVSHHGNDENVIRESNSLLAGRSVDISDFRENRGLSRSWNESIKKAIDQGCSGFLLLNDDLHFYENGFGSFVDFIRSQDQIESVGSVSLMGNETRGDNVGKVCRQAYACIYLNQRSMDAIGYFDENLTPAYFEDVDHARRAQLAGLISPTDSRVLVEHERSSTVRLNPDIAASISSWFTKNEDYYARKWGGKTPHETFVRPFGMDAIDLKIRWEDRDDPYGRWVEK